MKALLAGMVILMIGDSHMTTPGYLITTLHDDLMKQGAVVYSFGACGANAGEWATEGEAPCGSASRIKGGPVKTDRSPSASTHPLSQLISTYKPNLVVIVLGDTMAGYTSPQLARAWIWDQVSALTDEVKSSGTACAWVGPGWGTEGGSFGKTFVRVKEASDYLSTITAPCYYINSLVFSKPGEWGTIDGQHYNSAGYKNWGADIASVIDVLPPVKALSGQQ
ncbi:MAG: SGNH/GDSL hydrolase family protein [Parvibaculaceae bacterium]|nr:SGNH/GDSL hydrolase family protein [Parvibaculaceae bacterium]